ncbi:glycoside hydrolase family 26 protein [Streptomyces sp. NPDC052236]|uniref:glycoside hydrolase family 26 protein n=1 Tax=Streptomyces sp. NPDC052236 TaxID=3365686 RepID=UPI0037D7D1C1
MPHRRRLTGTRIGTVAAALLLSAGAAPAPAPVPAPGRYDPAGVQRMAELSRRLGGTEPRVGHTYLPGDVWSNFEGAPRFLESWAAWRRGADDRMFVLNVPMLERSEDHLPDSAVRRLLRAGADGRFDHHFQKLARRLVRLGVPDTVIVLGWEMNSVTYTHRCGPDPESWKAYWNRIVTAMRSVPGQRFRFDFAPKRGVNAIPWTECYPGDEVVDIIGMDSYDQPPGETFDEQVTAPYGLRRQVEFAAAHKKAISYPEWGLFRNGDNSEYMRRMLEWMDRHRPLYQTITDYCPHGVWQCEDNPESAEVFRSELFGDRDPVPKPAELTAPTPVPTPTKPAPAEEPVPAAPTPKPTPPPPISVPPRPTKPAPDPHPSPWCVPLDLGDWGNWDDLVNQWLSGRDAICVRRPGAAP